MFHQYGAQRRKGGHNPHGRGTIDVGTILYLQDGLRPLSGFRGPIVCRNPWIVESWCNREYHPATTGKPATTYCAGGHLAMVRSLRDGRRQLVADWILLACEDAGLERFAGRRVKGPKGGTMGPYKYYPLRRKVRAAGKSAQAA